MNNETPWLATLDSIMGTIEFEGSANNPAIIGWADVIAARFPELADYAHQYNADSIAWCGHAMGYLFAANGIRPPDGYLWARNWLNFGVACDPKPGCVLVFKRGSGGHVAIMKGETKTHFIILGGNQSGGAGKPDAVNETKYAKSALLGARWPSGVKMLPAAVSPIAGIGKSQPASVASKRMDVPKALGAASLRYNNPGAQYPSALAAKFGMIGYGVLTSKDGTHKIGRFPHVVNGAAANFATLDTDEYIGLSFGSAGKRWTGSYGFGIPGYPDSRILTREITRNPDLAIPIMKAIAQRELGKPSPLTDQQWRAAHAMFLAGSADAWMASNNVVPVNSPSTSGANTVNTVPTPIAIPQQPSAMSVIWNLLRGKPIVPPAPVEGVKRPGLSENGDPELYDIQVLLARKGWTMVGKPDGEMGPNTESAIMTFRNEKGLPVNTELGQEFLAALAASVVLSVVSTYSAGMAATLTLESTLPLVGVTVWALLVGVTLLLSLVMLTLPLPLW